MLSIYLCEDDQKQLNIWKDILEKYIIINEIPAKITFQTDSPERLFQELKKNTPAMGLYYLDVELRGDMDGFDLAEKIREVDPRSYLVFVTVHRELSYFPYDKHLEAMDYVIKGDREVLRARITQCLERALKNYYQASNIHNQIGHLALQISRKRYLIPYNEIILLETELNSHKVKIILENEIISKRGTIKEFMKQLDCNLFCQISQATVINVTYVEQVDQVNRQLIMKNKMRVDYSYRYKRMLFFMLEKYEKI